MRVCASMQQGAWIALAVLALGSNAAGAADAGTCLGDLAPGPTRTVVRIVDGETLGLDDGSELRLIGALAPRAIDVGAAPGAWPAERGTRNHLQGLVGKSIELGFGGDQLDRYGRLQAHAFVLEGDQRRWVQGDLLEHGLARAYAIAGHRACAEELLASEQAARVARRGLWDEAAYQIRQADQIAELRAYRSTYQIVEGRIARVAFVRGAIYLNFNRNWRQAFSALVQHGDRALLGRFAHDAKGIEGHQVRIRGWVEQRGRAPIINASVAGQIEILD